MSPAPAARTVEISAEIPRDLYLQLEEHFPFYGFKRWLIENTCRELLRQVERDPSMVQRVESLVGEMLRENRTTFGE